MLLKTEGNQVWALYDAMIHQHLPPTNGVSSLLSLNLRIYPLQAPSCPIYIINLSFLDFPSSLQASLSSLVQD